MTRFVNSVPHLEMAELRAISSALIWFCPPEAQIPRRRVVSEAMAAGIASIGSFVELPPC